MNLGYNQAPVKTAEFNDGYIRTFRQKEIPVFDDLKELEMMKNWVKKNKTDELWIYLTRPDYPDLDSEMAGFIIREIHRGNI
jgi:hypothetical protein